MRMVFAALIHSRHLLSGRQIQIAQAIPETYRYVAGYVTKKMYEIDGQKANVYYELGQQKPFACMSLKPGLGDSYYQEHKEES